MTSSNTHSGAERPLAVTALTALGVVYGDVGTSPLYSLRECFAGEHAMRVNALNVLGILSLIFWSLVVVITVKYLAYVMRADNDGEGGILALMALAIDPSRSGLGQRAVLLLGLFGAALLYGDGMITPAISVLSAVEGLGVAAPGLEHWVVPITLVILVGLFWLQQHGTHKVGTAFGPIVLLWFAVLAALGVVHIARHPSVLFALNPTYAGAFFAKHGLPGILVLGSVFLVVTGGEALYADMGHFGARPIRVAWLWVVLPALSLNYFGQGALLLAHPEAIRNPLYLMVPKWGLYPMIALGAMATVIASQAVISGAFSLTRQAIMLGYAPRLRVVHTSQEAIGQIYIPSVNWALMVATLLLVLGFKTSSGLAAAYGIAVTTTMVITTLLAFVVARRRFGWGLPAALAVTLAFVVVDLAFLGANVVKIADGGWVPLFVGAAVLLMMSTWKKGRTILGRRIAERSIPIEDLGDFLAKERPTRVHGTAVYLTAQPASVPLSMVENVRLNHSLHENVILLSLVFTQHVRTSVIDRLKVERLQDGFVRVVGHYGFMEQPDVPHLLELAIAEGIDLDLEDTTFVMGRETVLSTARQGMSRWREILFAFMSRNSTKAAAFFGMPSDRVLEIGAQIEI
jgi:KUP system potassium uptake protein